MQLSTGLEWKNPMAKWKPSTHETGHTQDSGRLRTSTHHALPAFLPNSTKWIKKSQEKKISAVHNFSAENYSSLSEKEKKVIKTMWTIRIIPLKQPFKRQCVGMPQLFISKLYLTTVMKWILQTGCSKHCASELTGSWHPVPLVWKRELVFSKEPARG